MDYELPKIVVTGASGFVGSRFMEYNQDRFNLIPISLRNTKPGEIDLSGVHTIVHLAGKAHDMHGADEGEYMRINYVLAKDLAEQAICQGVSHFIYMSTVKVYGDGVYDNLDEYSACQPGDTYGKSKLKAEQFLLSKRTDKFAVSIIRPSLVYGPGVKGNMYSLLKLAERNILLPFDGINNKRSMVFVDNLVELINCVIQIKAEGVFVATDPRSVSTTELVGLIRAYMGKKKKLVRLPGWSINLLQRLKPTLHKRLFGSFVVNNKKTCDRLYFTSPFSTEYGLKQMVDWYKKEQENHNRGDVETQSKNLKSQACRQESKV
jgi:nucleoside-diphosphate-sugar epimerase